MARVGCPWSNDAGRFGPRWGEVQGLRIEKRGEVHVAPIRPTACPPDGGYEGFLVMDSLTERMIVNECCDESMDPVLEECLSV